MVTKIPTAVEVEVQAAYRAMFPVATGCSFPNRSVGPLIVSAGRHPEYQRVDAGYHDFEHTLQVRFASHVCSTDVTRQTSVLA